MEASRSRAASEPGSRVGDVLAGKYRLEALLGSGGMGDVYRAVNQFVGRAVAIKLLRAEHAKNAQIVERFMREARAANLVRHENVVDVIDIGQDEDGFPFIVQELLDGEDLMAFARRIGGKVPLSDVVDLLCPVIDAVAEAHSKGVVHRDIKPENVFLVKKGAARIPKLLDFGISKVRSNDVRTTDVGVMLGTPAYMAPEQLQGARDADARTDVWAMGVMLFELLAGRLPFDAPDAPALFVSIATKDPPKLVDVAPEIPPNVSQIVERCLRRKPDERYPTAAELARDLRHVLERTEIEPTQKRSLPPGLAELVPDLLVPKAAALPKEAEEPDARVHDQKIPTMISRSADALVGKSGKSSNKKVPSLPPPPPPKAPDPPRQAAKSKAEKKPPRSPEVAIPPPAPAAMPGVMMAPGASSSTRASTPPHRRSALPDDMSSWLIGSVVVGFSAIFAFGLLMKVAHRLDGWPIMDFIARPNSALNMGVQGGLALVSSVVGMSYLRRGVKHWRGELTGGVVGAVVGGAIAAVAFFVAVELGTAAW